MTTLLILTDVYYNDSLIDIQIAKAFNTQHSNTTQSFHPHRDDHRRVCRFTRFVSFHLVTIQVCSF